MSSGTYLGRHTRMAPLEGEMFERRGAGNSDCFYNNNEKWRDVLILGIEFAFYLADRFISLLI